MPLATVAEWQRVVGLQERLEPWPAEVALEEIWEEVLRLRLQFRRIRESKAAIRTQDMAKEDLDRAMLPGIDQSYFTPPTGLEDILVHQEMHRQAWGRMSAEARSKYLRAVEDINIAKGEIFPVLRADVHSLLLSLAQVDILLRLVEHQLAHEAGVQQIRTRYAEMLEAGKQFREDTDRMGEWLPRLGVSAVGDTVHLEDSYEFGGHTYDIGPNQEGQVESFFEDLLRTCEAIAERQDARR